MSSDSDAPSERANYNNNNEPSRAPADQKGQRARFRLLTRTTWDAVEADARQDEYEAFQQIWIERRDRVVLAHRKKETPLVNARQGPAVASVPLSVVASTTSYLDDDNNNNNDDDDQAPMSNVKIWQIPLSETAHASSLRSTAANAGSSSYNNSNKTCSVRWYADGSVNSAVNSITNTVPTAALHSGSLLPSYTLCVPIRNSYHVEDEKSLLFVPYNDEIAEHGAEEDSVYRERFNLYDTSEREDLLEYGTPHEIQAEQEKVDETIRRCLSTNGEEVLDESKVKDILTELIRILGNPYWDFGRLWKRYLHVLEEPIGKPRAAASATASTTDVAVATGPAAAVAATGTPDELSHDERYLAGADSYRNMLCRRCFVYSCNLHGVAEKSSLQQQYELGIQSERERFPSLNGHANAGGNDNEDTKEDPFDYMDELTSFHKTICKRMFLIFDGDIAKMAIAMRAPRSLLEEYVQAEQFVVPGLELVRASKKSSVPYFSVRAYRPTWYKAITGSTFHSHFSPCVHDEPCSKETCSCIQNQRFCTIACAWRERSPNFFRGCDCRGPCVGLNCTCYANKRECDPDLCKRCQTCSDPSRKPATKQVCRNDNIAMQRGHPVLVAKSTVAGFGLFTRDQLNKGDFIVEYIGELISQEEGERRGGFYDHKKRSFLFNLDLDYVIDSTRKGNKARFINHSATPNCKARTVFSHGDFRIGIFATQQIDPQSELFFDYRCTSGDNKPIAMANEESLSWMQDDKPNN